MGKDESINVKNDIILLDNYFQSTRIYDSYKKEMEVFLVSWILKQWQKNEYKVANRINVISKLNLHVDKITASRETKYSKNETSSLP